MPSIQFIHVSDNPLPSVTVELPTLYSACACVEGFDGLEHTEEEVIAAWQFLIDTGAVWSLQGWYGRTATDLIEQGLCTRGKR